MTARIRVREVIDGALLVEYPEAPDAEANRLAVALGRELAQESLPELLDCVPGARTLLVLFEPRSLEAEGLTRKILRHRQHAASPAAERRILKIPVFYGGPAAADLSELADHLGITPAQFARVHAAAQYMVAFLGFAPGFAYLTGLPRELHAPRQATPRTRIPPGTIAIGGEYTGIYPGNTPGGWRLIGQTSVCLFEAGQNPPALFAAGDQVLFEPISQAEFERSQQTASTREGKSPAGRGIALFRVLRAGPWTSVQGAPRYGGAGYGVPAGGAMDREALALGNARLGNPPSAPGLEITYSGPELEALANAELTLAGADANARLNGSPVAADSTFAICRGDRLSIDRLTRGARSYLCVAGGLEPAGPYELSRRLTAGDIVGRGPGRGIGGPEVPREEDAGDRKPSTEPAGREVVLRVVLGPQEEAFAGEGVRAFLGGAYRVSTASDRRGIRLEGEPIPLRGTADIPPEGTAPGSIQVAGDGLPILLGPDGPVTGGYAKIATIIGADLSRAAQAVPGTLLRFRSVTLAEVALARRSLAGNVG